MRQTLTTLTLCATILTATLAQADTVAVFPVVTTNLEPAQGQVIGALLSQAYAARSGQTVIAPEGCSAALAAKGNRPAAAVELGAAEYLDSTAIGLSEHISLHVARMKADGTLVYRSQATATSLDDLPVVAERLARALVTGQELAETLSVEAVTGQEGIVPNRTWVEAVMGLKTQVILPIQSGETSYAPMVAFGFDGRLETRDSFLEFGGGLMLPGAASNDEQLAYGGLVGEIGYSRYLGQSSISPYLGAGLLPGIIFGDAGDGVRLAAYGQLGLMFQRESSSRFYVDLRIAQNLLGLRPDAEEDYVYNTETDSYDWVETRGDATYPTELTLSVGIGW